MKFTTDYRLEDFILDTTWDDLPAAVKARSRLCLLDLLGALTIGSRSRQFAAGLKMAETVFAPGEIPVLGTTKRLSCVGAAAAMGHASNAYDIDDGHNLIRAHPGTSFVGALLAAAYEADCTLTDLLTALVVSYEATIRLGKAVMDYYQHPHSSGTFGAFGVATGVGKLSGFSRERLANALSVAEFNAPIVPAERSVEYPSMNKDGVPFGVMAGMLSVFDAECGFTGNKHLLEHERYCHLTADLGTNYETLNLYFKPYPCCRWAHGAIDGILQLKQQYGFDHREVRWVVVHTFEAATRLAKIVPQNTDEAQYNIAYPLAAALVCGEVGLEQIADEKLTDPEVIAAMTRLCFVVDPEYEACFPARRFCRVEVEMQNGTCYCSETLEPAGAGGQHRTWTWLSEKYRRLTAPVISSELQEILLNTVENGTSEPIRGIIETYNSGQYWKY